MKDKPSSHDRDGREPLDPHELEKWIDRLERRRLWIHLLKPWEWEFYRNDRGIADPLELTVQMARRAKAVIVDLFKRPPRGD